MSLALAGGFLTTAPPGKSSLSLFLGGITIIIIIKILFYSKEWQTTSHRPNLAHGLFFTGYSVKWRILNHCATREALIFQIHIAHTEDLNSFLLPLITDLL